MYMYICMSVCVMILVSMYVCVGTLFYLCKGYLFKCLSCTYLGCYLVVWHCYLGSTGFTAISKISKIRELSGNLKNSLIFTKN